MLHLYLLALIYFFQLHCNVPVSDSSPFLQREKVSVGEFMWSQYTLLLFVVVVFIECQKVR